MDEIQRKLKDVRSDLYKTADRYIADTKNTTPILRGFAHRLGNVWFLISEERRANKPHECPCVIASKPCHPNCTCVNPVSSSGCYCCARYGSEAQRKDAADVIVKAMTNVAHD